MKITGLETGLYRVPLMRPSEDALHGRMHQIELVTAEITTDDGPAGCGYAYTIGAGGSAIKSLLDDYLAEIVIGRDPQMIEQIWHKMWWGLHWVGRGGLAAFALAAVDIALWDLSAKAAGIPLYRLLGGFNRSIPAYGSGVDLNLSDRELVAEVEGFLEEGFRAVKIKVGRDNPREDLERVRQVRRAIGDNIALMVDANMKWNFAQAFDMGKRLEEYNITWLEEPLIPEDMEGYRRLSGGLALPIAAGENLHSKYEFNSYLKAGALNVVQLDAVTVGGITEWLKVASMAEADNLPVSTHYAEEVQVHLLATIPNGWYAERHAYRLDHLLKEPLTMKAGSVSPPERPGHGLEFDPAKIERCRIA